MTRTFSINIMKLMKGLASNEWITINDEEKVKKFISKFDEYEDRMEILPDYNTKKRANNG
jgi:hypothetical protein